MVFKMIGQKNLLNTIDNLISNGFPKFTIIVGNKGSGKKLLTDYIANKLGITKVISGNKVEEVRDIISAAYQQKTNTLYAFFDIDNMSLNAKNALLKITEEPPKNAYFIVTAINKDKLLSTILSRGVLLQVDNYSPKEIGQLIKEFNYNLTPEEENIIVNICQTPGDINLLVSYNVLDFHDYCELVLDNISEVEGSNAFKIEDKLDIRGSGWDLIMFFNTISYISLTRLKETKEIAYAEVIKLCNRYKQDLNITGINKQMLMDSWILDVRKVL